MVVGSCLGSIKQFILPSCNTPQPDESTSQRRQHHQQLRTCIRRRDILLQTTQLICVLADDYFKRRASDASLVMTSQWPQVNTDLEHINEQATNTSAATASATSALNEVHSRHPTIALGSTRLGSPSITVQAANAIPRTGLPKPSGQPYPQCSNHGADE